MGQEEASCRIRLRLDPEVSETFSHHTLELLDL
jgi:hypothetical protein